MNRFAIVFGAAVLGATALAPLAAHADGWRHDGGWRGDRGWHDGYRGGGWGGPSLAFGFAAPVIVEAPRYYAPPPVYYAPPPVVYRAPAPVYYAPPPVAYVPAPVAPSLSLGVNIPLR